MWRMLTALLLVLMLVLGLAWYREWFTLSANHPAYNPLKYHLGSVWPVEQATFALGFKRYGLDEHLDRPHRCGRLVDEVGGCVRLGKIARDAELRADVRTSLFDASGITPADDHTGTFSCEKTRRLETDSAGRARDEAGAIAQAEVHWLASLAS